MRRAVPGSLVLAVVTACSVGDAPGPRDFPVDPGPGGKTDVFGRRLAGVASDYEAADLDEDVLQSDARRRREAAWASVAKVLEPVPLLGLADSADEHEDIELPGREVPRVPRFLTWYGVDDFKRMFQDLYTDLDPSDRAVRRPFTDEEIARAEEDNARALDRSERWPLERYLRYVERLGVCPDGMSAAECAALLQGNLGGAVSGTTRILYSPSTVTHTLRNYGRILECLGELDELTLEAEPADEDNFTLCFDSELPESSVLIKAQWERADFGRDVPAYDTDADTMTAHLAGTAHWGEDGDRRADPAADDIFTVRLRSGATYRLVGLHIMTKELRHWQWITLWWSDEPDVDFGADRPEALRESVWRNYKMCVTTGFREEDPTPGARYDDAPSLARALRATTDGAGGPSWCSNPYIENGRHNARTNCVGCHQHGGATVIGDLDGDGDLDPLEQEDILDDEMWFPATGRRQIREVFPADYMYSFDKVDDLSHVIRSEVSFVDDADAADVRPRVDDILSLDGTPAAGAQLFAANCVPCHGPTGEGTAFAPNLHDRVPPRADASIVQTFLLGRGDMPSWADLDDQQLADLLAHLRTTFDAPPVEP